MCHIKMERQIRTPLAPPLPIFDFAHFCLQRRTHRQLRRRTIGPCGRRGYITLALQPLPQFVIGTPDMLAKSVPAAVFVFR
jgi:hypothetical protein